MLSRRQSLHGKKVPGTLGLCYDGRLCLPYVHMSTYIPYVWDIERTDGSEKHKRESRSDVHF